MLAQAFLVFVTMWLSSGVNYDLKQSDAFPGDLRLLLYCLNHGAREEAALKLYLNNRSKTENLTVPSVFFP